MARLTKSSDLEDMSGGFEFTQAGIRAAVDSNSDKVPKIAEELQTNAGPLLVLIFGGNMPEIIEQAGGQIIVQDWVVTGFPPTVPGVTSVMQGLANQFQAAGFVWHP